MLGDNALKEAIKTCAIVAGTRSPCRAVVQRLQRTACAKAANLTDAWPLCRMQNHPDDAVIPNQAPRSLPISLSMNPRYTNSDPIGMRMCSRGENRMSSDWDSVLKYSM